MCTFEMFHGKKEYDTKYLKFILYLQFFSCLFNLGVQWIRDMKNQSRSEYKRGQMLAYPREREETMLSLRVWPREGG